MGVLLLIHPQSGQAIACQRGEGKLARALILDGFNPIGPRGQAAAKAIRAAAQPQQGN